MLTLTGISAYGQYFSVTCDITKLGTLDFVYHFNFLSSLNYFKCIQLYFYSTRSLSGILQYIYHFPLTNKSFLLV